MTRPSLSALLLLVGLPAIAFAARPSPWSVVATPNRGPQANALNAVSVAPDGTTWAVGHWYDTNLAAYRTLTTRATSSAWTTVASPNATNGYNELLGVAAVSANEAWAVGYSRTSQYDPPQTLILHFTGGAWRTVPSPNPGPYDNTLYAVLAVAPDDVWAAGWYYDPSHFGRALLLHWNGSQWTQVATPVNSTFDAAQALSATGPQDVWAAGRTLQSGKYVAYSLHWDGAQWSVVPMPGVAGKHTQIRGLAAISPDDVWAVGDAQNRSLIEHWNGTQWTIVPAVDLGSYYNVLWSVSARANGAVWAAGYRYSDTGIQPLIQRWDGLAWRLEPTPAQSGVMPSLFGIGGAPGGALWAVGLMNTGGADRTLSLRAIQ